MYTLFELKVYSQNDVELTVTGIGTDAENSKNNALRSAIEQAYGAFISSSTLIKNDELEKDEIVSLSNGNIKKFDVLSQYKMPDSSWVSSLKCIVSVNQLNTYCQSKGMKTDFNGSLFAFNAAQKELSAKNEKKVFADLVEIVRFSCENIYNYSISIIDPVKSSNSYVIPTQVNISINDNYRNIYTLILATIQNASIPNNQVEDFKKMNFELYKFEIMHQDKETEFGNFYLTTTDDFSGNGLGVYPIPWYDWAKHYSFKWDTKSMLCIMQKLILVEPKIGFEHFAINGRSNVEQVLFIDKNYNFKKITSSGVLFFRTDISSYLNTISTIITSKMDEYSVKINDKNISSEKRSFVVYPFFNPYDKQFICFPYNYCWLGQTTYQVGDINFLNYERKSNNEIKDIYTLKIKGNNSKVFILNNIKPGSCIGMVATNLNLNLEDLKHLENISVKRK